jgi:hypothetical protein
MLNFESSGQEEVRNQEQNGEILQKIDNYIEANYGISNFADLVQQYILSVLNLESPGQDGYIWAEAIHLEKFDVLHLVQLLAIKYLQRICNVDNQVMLIMTMNDLISTVNKEKLSAYSFYTLEFILKEHGGEFHANFRNPKTNLSPGNNEGKPIRNVTVDPEKFANLLKRLFRDNEIENIIEEIATLHKAHGGLANEFVKSILSIFGELDPSADSVPIVQEADLAPFFSNLVLQVLRNCLNRNYTTSEEEETQVSFEFIVYNDNQKVYYVARNGKLYKKIKNEQREEEESVQIEYIGKLKEDIENAEYLARPTASTYYRDLYPLIYFVLQFMTGYKVLWLEDLDDVPHYKNAYQSLLEKNGFEDLMCTVPYHEDLSNFLVNISFLKLLIQVVNKILFKEDVNEEDVKKREVISKHIDEIYNVINEENLYKSIISQLKESSKHGEVNLISEDYSILKEKIDRIKEIIEGEKKEGIDIDKGRVSEILQDLMHIIHNIIALFYIRYIINIKPVNLQEQ